MKLESVLALKTSMMRSARTLTTRTLRTARRPRTRMEISAAAPRRPVALAFGAAPKRGRGEYKLAVRVLGATVRQAAPMMPDLSALSEQELDIVDRVRYAPRLTLRAGHSCGHFEITAGTLGTFVEDDENYYILSNNHVLANSDDAHKGDEIWQPGPLDANGDYDVIGHLERWARLSTRTRNGVDAALARFSDDVVEFYPWRYPRLGEIDPRPITDRFAVTRVVKHGRTTGYTTGVVSAFDLDGVEIDYSEDDEPRVVTFDNQLEFIHSRPTRWDFSAPGDSGSLIIDRDTRRPYALLYGGGPDGQGIDRTLGHFLPDVLDRLQVRMVQ